VAAELDAALRDAQSRSLFVVVDLGDLEFVDSSGLHVFLRAETRARAAGARLVLAAARAPVRRVFDLTGATSRLELAEVLPDPLHQ
jgi:anti-sigma B factor antagonist